MATRTVGEMLRERGLRPGMPGYCDAACRILCGDAEWERLSALRPEQVEAELDAVTREQFEAERQEAFNK